MEILIHNFVHGFQIALLVFVMMVIIDFINTISQGKMTKFLNQSGSDFSQNSSKKQGNLKQYFISSFLGVTPGCLGAFANTSFYIHGVLSFGALTAGMIATSGDEAFVMLAMFPKKAFLLFGILFFVGIFSGYIIDYVRSQFLQSEDTSAKNCPHQIVHKEEKKHIASFKNIKLIFNGSIIRFVFLILPVSFGLFIFFHAQKIDGIKISVFILLGIMFFITLFSSKHYIEEHIFNHIAKKHFLRIFLWSFASLLVIDIALNYWDFSTFARNHMAWILLLSAVVGIIPESGPNLIFITLFAEGVVPFSVLLTSSIVQDGHGMLPLLSYSVKDSLVIKAINIAIGLAVGGGLYLLGY